MPLLRKDNCRSGRIFTDVQGFSVQISQEIFFRSFWETIYFISRILQQVFLLTNSQSVESLHRPKFLITVILVCGGCLVLVLHANLSISLELSRSVCSTLRGSFAILTSIWRMYLDMWLPSGLVEVLIK